MRGRKPWEISYGGSKYWQGAVSEPSSLISRMPLPCSPTPTKNMCWKSAVNGSGCAARRENGNSILTWYSWIRTRTLHWEFLFSHGFHSYEVRDFEISNFSHFVPFTKKHLRCDPFTSRKLLILFILMLCQRQHALQILIDAFAQT